ncbi:MAG: HlyD family efflux transporter periplasmic adaptor subunit [Bacteroidales bacterium]|jgi:hypothetical protein|nr:HlyD family efflux transporter periplasmic adaptor subunit [Bacteroidales bacterium]
MNDKDMELRSEKVRNIVGQIPSYFLRTGIFIISITIFSLLLISCLISYEEYEIVLSELHCRPAYQTGQMLENGNFYITVSHENIHEKQCAGYIKDGKDSIIRLYSHVNGKITYNCKTGDYLKKNDIIFSIIPDTIAQVLAVSYIASDKICKIKINQNVILYLANGNNVKGYISYIYPIVIADSITNNLNYKVEAILNYDKNIDLSQIEVTHKMKILVSKKTLLKKILSL